MVTRVVNRAPLIEMSAASVTTSYTSIGVLPGPCRCIKLKSSLNGDVYLTYDVTKNHIWLSAGMSQVEDHTSNSPANGDVWEEPKGREYFIKWDGDAPVSPTGKVVIEFNIPQVGV